jgi:hypothetical protein
MTDSVTDDSDQALANLRPLLTDLEAEVGQAKKHPAAAGVPFAGVDAAIQRLVGAITAATAGVGPELQRLADQINESAASAALSPVEASTLGPRTSSAKPS